jgi:hypothetical protein
MRIDKLIQITLTDEEMKEAVLDYLEKTAAEKYFNHVKKNGFLIDHVDEQYVLCVDGTMPEEC